jgi:predicted acyl esterase
MDQRDEEARALDEHRAVFGEYRSHTPLEYDGQKNEALYIPMSDGTRIAMDVTLPAPLAAGVRIPAVLYF